MAKLYNDEYLTLQTDIERFKSNNNLDEDIVRNLDLTRKRLNGTCTVENLLNIFELKSQLQQLTNPEINK